MHSDLLKRREFITLLGGAAAAWPSHGLAQSPPKRPLIGLLFSSSKAEGARYYSGFPLGMRELGYSEGRHYGLAWLDSSFYGETDEFLAEILGYAHSMRDSVWAVIFAVGYVLKGSTPGYPLLHVFGGFLLGMLSMYIAMRVYPS
jgi:hypothetical protein